MNNLKSYARLTFKTRAGNHLVIDDSNDCILAVKTCKEISNPNGTFSIILSPRIAKQLAIERGSLALSDIVVPYDLVQIEFKVNDKGYKTEMIGLISRASVTLHIGSSGVPQRAIKIDGFDMGMALKNFKIFFSPFVIGTRLNEYGGKIIFGTDNHLFEGKNPAEFIQAFVTLAVGKFGQPGSDQFSYPLTFPNGLQIPNYMDFKSGISTSFKTNIILDPFILTNIQPNVEVSVYDILKFYSDIPYHEIFMDLRRPGPGLSVEQAEKTHTIQPINDGNGSSSTPNNQPYVFTMRTSPFSQGKQSWDGLSSHDFLTSDIITRDVATSEENIYNYYDLICERQSFALGDLQMAYVSEHGKSKDATTGETITRFPIQDHDSIKKYGIKRFPFHTTKYVEFVSSANTVKTRLTKYNDYLLPITQIRTLTRQLLRWFAFGEDFESGTISFKGRVGVGPDGITMGSRLIEKNPSGHPTGKQYYIESVLQEFTLGEPLKTTAAVTRGHYPDDWTDSVGATHLGRFSLVKQLEEQLHLDQETNSQFFNAVDAEDGV